MTDEEAQALANAVDLFTFIRRVLPELDKQTDAIAELVAPPAEEGGRPPNLKTRDVAAFELSPGLVNLHRALRNAERTRNG